MDKNSLIGFGLIFMLLMAWSYFTSPTPEEVRQKAVRDSIQQVQDSLANEKLADPLPPETTEETETELTADPVANDSLRNLRLYAQFGAFSPSGAGEEQLDSLENDLMRVVFTSKGGRIKEVLLKNYFKSTFDKEHNETKIPLKLLEDEKNEFSYEIPLKEAAGGVVNTEDLYFTLSKDATANSIAFRAQAEGGAYFEQRYTLNPDNYELEYEVKLEGLDRSLREMDKGLRLKWVNFLDRIEFNTDYERNYSSVYYKVVDDDPDHCSCTGEDTENIDDEKVQWVANSNQFFNSTLIGNVPFNSAKLNIGLTDENSEDLKVIISELDLPIGRGQSSAGMKFYIGPNEFDRLAAYDASVQYIIPYGSSVFGTVNRWIIRPVFNVLSSFIGNMGIVILVLTFLVKLVLYPLTYRMLYSQSKMGAMKPRIAALKEKLGDDQQAVQMETMKLYREFGVNPLGGCLPIVLQMPIWFALYRFFPASIEFRQASFLWATDLSSFDVITYLPFNIPFYGEHVSLFTLLWAVTTVIYTYYNTRHMDMSVNPAMKYMQYFMPIMFLFFFNNFASGLSCYLFFSNMFNILQTVVTKNYIINQDKIKDELEAYRKKPKKKGGFGQRLEAAMREAQRQQEERNGKKKKK